MEQGGDEAKGARGSGEKVWRLGFDLFACSRGRAWGAGGGDWRIPRGHGKGTPNQ